MTDTRAYVYRYLAKSARWGFIALGGTSMHNNAVMLAPVEIWIATDGEVYTLSNVCYSKAKATQLIKDMSEKSFMELVVAMSGTDIFQLHKGNLLCGVIWKPHVTDGLIEIHSIVDAKHSMVAERVNFEGLVVEIQSLMSIEVKSVNSESRIHHIIDDA